MADQLGKAAITLAAAVGVAALGYGWHFYMTRMYRLSGDKSDGGFARFSRMRRTSGDVFFAIFVLVLLIKAVAFLFE